MCARYTQIQDLRAILALVQCRGGLPAWMPRYNIAPAQEAPVIVNTGKAVEAKLMRWGMVPTWAEDPSTVAPLINARAETLQQKPSFREAFLSRRCLVPADGFYEWETTSAGKRPWRFTLRSEEPFCFAGLWSVWQPRLGRQQELFTPTGAAARPVEAFTIITTAANELVQVLHERMPVILTGEAIKAWIDPATSREKLQSMLRPYPTHLMQRQAASRRVNRPDFEGPECLNEVAR